MFKKLKQHLSKNSAIKNPKKAAKELATSHFGKNPDQKSMVNKTKGQTR